MKATEIMSKNVVTIPAAATVATAVKLMKTRGIRTLIVERLQQEDAYGIVTETDIVNKVAAFGRDPQKMRIYEIMTKPCIVINPELGVEYVARLFAETGIRTAPVIQKELLGIISVTDILDKSNFVEEPKELWFEEKIQESIEEARSLCQEKGFQRECLQAWRQVEELQAEAAHQRGIKIARTALEEYCEENPEAWDTLMMDNWCSG